MRFHRTFDTWGDYLQAAEKSGPPKGAGTDRWAGGSWVEAIDLATNGYHDVIDEASDLSSHVAETVAMDLFQTTFQARHDVAGAEVDMGRFLSGEPECMIESAPIRIARSGRAVRIAVPVCYSGSIDVGIIRRRGAAVMALVDILSRAQHPLEVWAVIALGARGIGRGGHHGTWAIRVQGANEPLDMGRTMFALAHPTMLRQLGFAVEELESAAVKKAFNIGGSYGFPGYGTSADDLPEAEGTTILLPELTGSESWDEAYAVRWIESQLACIFGE